MKYIAAPWRADYVKKVFEMKGCVFCRALKSEIDKDVHILYRGRYNFVMLNRYPYNPGHLMIAPFGHCDSIEKAEKDSSDEMMDLIKNSMSLLRDHYSPQGFNTGMNIGRSSGAGVESHYHFHIIPRWIGDSNFMPIIGQTKVVIEDLDTTYSDLKPLFDEMKGDGNTR
ncbi:MAG: HIT domain-containing protein [Acidobacteria bacterium]|nr:HIT domain-containing protein [Acidobacteriota bacterium]MBU1338106.1 HIT domain-containing protein [Acidobacteriota bacterium]MBU1475013.1 HIT domain-containing protein [Acidobacteriota bacterium]MBU2437690.1 HIT domain-containing protein [Acidobacteriota bacterium]MBU4203791.1 HIT domain-containing protein [Acidobacteriota bacterium]